jgi:uncharacterized OB-fold protein
MTETTHPFTIESFYKFVQEGKLMAAKCSKCGKLHVPPRPMCPKCFSKELEWKELPNKGKLVTYTVIHVSPKHFQKLTPYAVGIIELQSGAQLPGMIRDAAVDDLQIGMELTVNFEKDLASSEDWPQWPRYYFKPMT